MASRKVDGKGLSAEAALAYVAANGNETQRVDLMRALVTIIKETKVSKSVGTDKYEQFTQAVSQLIALLRQPDVRPYITDEDLNAVIAKVKTASFLSGPSTVSPELASKSTALRVERGMDTDLPDHGLARVGARFSHFADPALGVFAHFARSLEEIQNGVEKPKRRQDNLVKELLAYHPDRARYERDRFVGRVDVLVRSMQNDYIRSGITVEEVEKILAIVEYAAPAEYGRIYKAFEEVPSLPTPVATR